VLSVNVRVIVAAAGTGSGSSVGQQSQAARSANVSGSCTAKKLLPALTTLGQSFTVSAGYPVALSVNVKDDCGAALSSGSVAVSFSNGDPLLALQALKDGRWEGTWATQNGALPQVTLTVRANDPQRQIQGQSQVSGALGAPTEPPVFTKNGIVSVAGLQPFVPLAPGSIISIFGERLAQSTIKASSPPLKTNLGGTSVLMAGRLLPLTYVSSTQINAIVPFEINFNTTQQILVDNGPTLSLPVSVDVAAAQPAVFSIVDVPADKSASYTVTAATPAKPGDGLLIYCEGLGLTSPAVADGAAAPSNPLAKTKNGAQVTIGKVSAPVQSASLAPGMVGIYQITASLPNNVPSGSAVPLSVTVAGQTGPPATMAIK